MDPSQRYLFDTFGYVRIPGVLTAEEVALLNSGIDRHAHDFHERTGPVRNSEIGNGGRRDCGNFLSWPDSDGGAVFRSLLCHPNLVPVLNEVCGLGHRLDHSPLLFSQPTGAEGFDLHGGAVKSDGSLNFPISYRCQNGHIVCSLVNVAVQLSDCEKGSGGFVVVPGSHKSNFYPPDLPTIAENFGHQPECEAGDVILFTEAILHGASVRVAKQDRRVVLIRFAPPTCAYARGYLEPDDYRMLLTPAQCAVVAPPYHLDQDRPAPVLGTVSVPHRRKADKKAFDRTVFDKDYY